MTKQSLSKKQKTTKQVVVVGPPIKKRLGKMGLGEMRLGEMRFGEMLPNRITHICRQQYHQPV